MKGISRRRFLQGSALAGIGMAGVGALSACNGNASTGNSSVSKNQSISSNSSSSRNLGTAVFEVTSEEIAADEIIEVDVIAVGSGLGGFAAAMTAAEESSQAKVVLLEKNSTLGGSTNMAECPVGMRPFTYTDAEAREAAQAQLDYTKGICNPMLIYCMCRDMEENTTWLFDRHGVQWYKEGPAPVFYEGGNGASAIKTLSATAETYENLEILTESPVTQLLLEDEYTVKGVRVKTKDNRYIDYLAKGVVLATGGMSTNKELLAQYSSQDMEKTIGWGQGQDGDGQLMVEETAHGRANHLGLMSLFNNVLGFAYDSPLGVCVSMQPTNFWVNEDGIRFANEDASSTALSGKLVETQGSVWSILDATHVENYAKGGCTRHYSGFADVLAGNLIEGLQEEIDKALQDFNTECFKADTIEALAQAIGVDPANLQSSVDAYNAGADEQWGKDTEKVWPLTAPPFYAFRLASGTLCTTGGIRINTTAQVIDARGKIIKGLYAAGVCTSGWDSDVYNEGTGQPNSLYCGRTAAKHIVKNL